MTPEQRKAKKREYDREYRKKNEVRLKAVHAAWRERNREYKSKRDREWREENKERKSATNKDWYKKNKDKYRAIDLKRNYGISVEQYDAMHTAQGGLCAVCGGVNANGKRLAVDHDHKTGAIRQLLCLSCNLVVGHSRENPAILRAAAAYVERHLTQ